MNEAIAGFLAVIEEQSKQIATLTAKIDTHTACSVPVNKPDLPVPFKMPCSVSIRVYIDELQARIKELEGALGNLIMVSESCEQCYEEAEIAKAALEVKP